MLTKTKRYQQWNGIVKKIDDTTSDDMEMLLKNIEIKTFKHMVDLINKIIPESNNDDRISFSITIQLAARMICIMSGNEKPVREKLLTHFNKELNKIVMEATVIRMTVPESGTVH